MSSDPTSTTTSATASTDTSSTECPEKRLRRTNAFEECGDLLDEIEAPATAQNWKGRKVQGQGHHDATQTTTGHPKILPHTQQDGWKEPEMAVVENVHITLDTAGIRSGDLLLFEDGPVLQRGIVKLSVYLWVKNLDNLTVPVTSLADSTMTNANNTTTAAANGGDLSAPATPGKNAFGQRQGQGQGQGQGQQQGQSGRGSERGGGRAKRRESNGRDGRKSKGESADSAPMQVQGVVQAVRATPEKVGGLKNDVSTAGDQISSTTVLEVTEKEVVKEEVAELNAFATAVKERSKHLLPLYVAVPICLPEDSSLLQLQRAVWTGLQGEAVAVALRGVLPSWKGESLTSLLASLFSLICGLQATIHRIHRYFP